ncbi:MAG: hypothetical protein LW650_12920 [Planctomycetaceae bacterium]|nr:hypothetical protein [Phycisphaerales bacterium]MCE2654316.1 hypothetical protein [Planctomycetaceae bacterium]
MRTADSITDDGRALGRMVLLRHELPDGSWHFDWMLERPPWGEVRKSSEDRCLATWRVMERVDRLRAAGTRVAGETLADHRRVYLWHDGAVGGGSGGNGVVHRLAEGEIGWWRVIADSGLLVVCRWRSAAEGGASAPGDSGPGVKAVVVEHDVGPWMNWRCRLLHGGRAEWMVVDEAVG